MGGSLTTFKAHTYTTESSRASWRSPRYKVEIGREWRVRRMCSFFRGLCGCVCVSVCVYVECAYIDISWLARNSSRYVSRYAGAERIFPLLDTSLFSSSFFRHCHHYHRFYLSLYPSPDCVQNLGAFCKIYAYKSIRSNQYRYIQYRVRARSRRYYVYIYTYTYICA